MQERRAFLRKRLSASAPLHPPHPDALTIEISISEHTDASLEAGQDCDGGAAVAAARCVCVCVCVCVFV